MSTSMSELAATREVEARANAAFAAALAEEARIQENFMRMHLDETALVAAALSAAVAATAVYRSSCSHCHQTSATPSAVAVAAVVAAVYQSSYTDCHQTATACVSLLLLLSISRTVATVIRLQSP